MKSAGGEESWKGEDEGEMAQVSSRSKSSAIIGRVSRQTRSEDRSEDGERLKTPTGRMKTLSHDVTSGSAGAGVVGEDV